MVFQWRQVLDLDDVVLGHCQGPLQDVFQFPDIAREGIILEHAESFLADARLRHAVFPGDEFQVVPGQ